MYGDSMNNIDVMKS